MLLRFRAIARLPVELAEVEVAAGHERTHRELVSERSSL